MWYINEENHQYLVVIVAKSSEKITSCTLVSTLTLLAPGSNLPLLAPGAYAPPPPHKIPGTCSLGLGHGRVSQGGLCITLIAKNSHPRSSRCLRDILYMSRQNAIRRDFTEILLDFRHLALTKPA